MSEIEDREFKIQRPRMVLRVGFAGKQEVAPKTDLKGKDLKEGDREKIRKSVDARIGMVLKTIGEQLVELAPHTRCKDGGGPAISRFYKRENPLLRLITGLCQGADEMAFRKLRSLKVECLETENASVIGFPLEDYRKSREDKYPEFLDEFDAEVKQSAYVLEGDGIMDPGSKKRRSRGYRLQSDLLLRQSDLMIVVVDPEREGKAGGSLETVGKALAFQLPVVLIRPSSDGIQVLEYDENLPDQLEDHHEEDWQKQLKRCVEKIVADPDLSANVTGLDDENHGEAILEEFFSGQFADSQDGRVSLPELSSGGRRWEKFVNRFKTRAEKEKLKQESDLRKQNRDSKKPKPTYQGKRIYQDYQERASDLSKHYARKYRNTFFSNSRFAMLAVLLASVSLLLLSQNLAKPGEILIIFLIVFAVWKFGLVCLIYDSSHKANHQHWNDRNVDFRYLAERLRAMNFLTEARIWQPPAAAPPQYASRVVRQSAVDWLFDAIIRAGSPGSWANEERVIKAPDPEETAGLLERLKVSWLEDQETYHRRNARTMGRMSKRLERTGFLLNVLVLAIVFFDVVLLIWKLSGGGLGIIKPLTPWIVLVTALIPAMVASVNLVRFQSECERLAERSLVLVQILGGRSKPKVKAEKTKEGKHHHSHNGWSRVSGFCSHLWKTLRAWYDYNGERWPKKSERHPNERTGGQIQKAKTLLQRLEDDQDGAHLGRVAHFTENCAEIFVQEVAEWSVLYAKELAEP